MNTALKKNNNEDQKINYHSLNEFERHRALEKLSLQNTSDAARELVQIFNTSQWRETKLFIIKNITKCNNQRTLEFLIEQTSNGKDIPLAEQAIKSLGALENELARKFLVQLYKNGPDYLKPAVVLALTEARDRNLVKQFVTDLGEAFTHQRQYLTKNLIYAVGELKCKEARPVLLDIIGKTEFKDLSLSALIALGKITRDLNDITQFEKKFSTDTFEFQIYQNVKNQVMLRANWKAEDYLQKIFTEKSYHAAMPLELNTFSEADVRAGLDLFVTPDKQKALFDILSKVSFGNMAEWYRDFQSIFANLNADLYRSSLSYQHSDSYFEVINAQKDLKSESWYHLLISTLPSADKIFSDIFKSEEYKNLEISDKVLVINQYLNWAFIYKFDTKKLSHFEKNMEHLLSSEQDLSIQTRIVRAFAQLSIDNAKVNAFIKSNPYKKELVDSCLFYFERSPSIFAVDMLENYVNHELVSSHFSMQLLRALSAQNSQILKSKKIENYLASLAKGHRSSELQTQLLVLLSRHPFASLKSFTVDSLKSADIEVQLNAVIALKSYADEKSADDVAQLLKSAVDTVRGRTLDTLLTLPGLRAKRLAFDYFIENCNQSDIVEQICRRFELPQNASDYFYNKMTELINQNPEHKQLSSLEELKEKLFVAYQTETLLHNNKIDAETMNLDSELSKKISDYNEYDQVVKSALRSAELPFVHPEMYTSFVDKSTCVLGYSKAIDIILEKQLGRKLLFPRLETKLHEFQNLVHLFELNDSNPSFDRVLKNLALEKHFNQQTLPLHKMSLVGHGVLNSKIINEHFKILDGLRAWAVVLLLFARKTHLVQKPLISVSEDDSLIIGLAKKLMWLQDLRNPVAHRQTLNDFKAVEQARTEVIDMLNSLNKLLKS